MGLDGAEAAKRGCRREPPARDSQSGLGFGPREVGEESGGVTGALLEIRSGGRFAGIAAMLRRNGRRYDDGFPSKRVGLGNDEDVGLAWYDGIGLGYDDDCGLGCTDEHALMLADAPPISIAGGLHPCRKTTNPWYQYQFQNAQI